MIAPGSLQNNAVPPGALTDRQREVEILVSRYVSVAHEWPSSSWLSRRLKISRKRAWEHLRAVRLRAGIIER